MALAHVDHAVRAGFVEPDRWPAAAVDRAQRRAAARIRRREVDRRDQFGLEFLPVRGVDHPVAHEPGQRLLVEVLQLAPAAAAEVAARRDGAVRPRLQRAVGHEQVAGRGERDMAARRGDAVALGGDAENLFWVSHSAAA